MNSPEFVDPRQTPIFTIQAAISPLDVWNKIIHIRNGGEFEAVPIRRIKKTGGFCLNSTAEDPRSSSGRIDGGNHRAIASLIEGVPLAINVGRRATKLKIMSRPLPELRFTDNFVSLPEKIKEFPEYYTEIPTEDDLAYMTERLDVYRDPKSAIRYSLPEEDMSHLGR